MTLKGYNYNSSSARRTLSQQSETDVVTYKMFFLILSVLKVYIVLIPVYALRLVLSQILQE